MKKQILTLTMCLAMTATTAFAETTTTVPVSVPCKAKLEKPCDPCMMPNEAGKKQFEAKMNKERELFHSALGLTPEQKKKADILDQKSRTDAEPLFKKMREEKVKLMDLKAKNASNEEILKQKMALKTAKKALKKHFEASRKDFEAILTKDQLAKLKILHEQRKTEMKKHRKEHKGHHCNHDLGDFHGPEAHHALPLSGEDAEKGACPAKCPCGK